jgi:hypothetical protein
MYDKGRPFQEQECKLYSLLGAQTSHIQVQICQGCQTSTRHQSIGPDAQALGIFNFDNTHLFMHDLLDEYTSAYTSSETPFVAWATVMGQHYKLYDSGIPFVHPNIFHSVWFSYVLTQVFEGDFKCPICGPTPKVTIWDGIFLAFQKKHLLDSMRPPTLSDDDSCNWNNQYLGKQQAIQDAALHKSIKGVVKGEPLPTKAEMDAWAR